MSDDTSTEQAMLRDSAQRFAESEYAFDQRQRRLAAPPGDPGCWAGIAGLGWLGLPFDEARGGYGGGFPDVAVLMRQFGRSLIVEPYLESVVLAGGLIARLGTQAQQSRWLAPMIDGSLRLAFAFAEPQSRFRIDDCALRAASSPGGWTLDGRKVVVQGGAGADAFVVLARSDGERFGESGLSLLVVPADAAGLSAMRYRNYDGHDACDLVFDSVRVGADALLGAAGAAYPEAERIVDVGAAMACAEAVGVLEVLFEDTLAYLKERTQFGRTLASNQALQHRLVDMRIQMREAQAMSAMAVDALGEADRIGGAEGLALRRRSVSAAKVHLGQALRLLGQEAVQMHGAIGTTDEMRISHHFRRATALGIAFGDVDTHRRRFGELMRDASAPAQGATR